jgi:hypothetical protein
MATCGLFHPDPEGVTMTETHAEKTGQYWCFDGSSWRLIDDPLGPGDPGGSSLFEMYGQFGFEPLLGPGDEAEAHSAHMTLWTRDGKPECVIDIFHGGVNGGNAAVYADRLPDGIDLFTRWAPAIYSHGSEPVPST